MKTARRRLVAYVANTEISAVVDMGGTPLVYDGMWYRSPDAVRALARSLLDAADRAEEMMLEDES